MNPLFSVVAQLLQRLQPPCAICSAESFPRQFAALEQALRTAYPAEKGFRVRVTRSNNSWALYACRGFWAGFAVKCTPVAEAESFSPARVSVRVSHFSRVFSPAALLLLALYFSLIGLAWFAQFVGLGQMPGPGLIALLGALGVIVGMMLVGTALGSYWRATGQYPRLEAQLDDVRGVVRSVLSADSQALFTECVKAQRFRRVLGSFLVCFGLLAMGLSCIFLWQWWSRTGDLTPSGFLLLMAALLGFMAADLGFLAYMCLRQTAPEKPLN
jgi:hypothetical protein